MPKYMSREIPMDTVKSKEGLVSINYPMLGRYNYEAWAIKMKVLMQAQGIWDAVDPKDLKVAVEVRKDKMAMAAIYQAIPEELLYSLAEKQSAKDVWDALKTLMFTTGVHRVKASKIKSLKAEFDALNLQEADQIDDFFIKLNNIDGLTPQALPVSLTALLQEKPLGTSRLASDFTLWQGREVKSEFLGILDCIAKKYPETFDNIAVNSMKLCTTKLNMLCTIVKAFTETPMSELDSTMIAEYRDLFANLQKTYNVKWLVEHLNYIEQLQFSKPVLDKLHAVDSRIDIAISKLQELQALRVKMTQEINRNNAVGYIGDYLFSSP